MTALHSIQAIPLALVLTLAAACAEPTQPQDHDMDTDWLIVPHQGVGRLTFGLSPEAVASMEATYGKPSPLLSHAYLLATVEDQITSAGTSLTVDTAEAMRQAARAVANLATQNLEIDQVPILLEYRDGRLDTITVEAGRTQTSFAGQAIFALDARDALALFEHANGAPGRYASDFAAFDNIAVSLYRFSITTPEGAVRAATQDDRDFNIRSVTVRRKPYYPTDEDELDAFVTFSFK